jgi:hypothetical protein
LLTEIIFGIRKRRKFYGLALSHRRHRFGGERHHLHEVGVHPADAVGVALYILWPELYGLTIVLKHLDVSIAYAIWSGLGTALIAVIGILYFQEPLSALNHTL